MADNQRKIKISDEELDDLIKKMEALPQKPPPSDGLRKKSDVIAKLLPTIRQMMQRGYSIKNIYEFLKTQSIDISEVTLSKATRTTRRKRLKTKKTEEKKQDVQTIEQSSKTENQAKPLIPFGKSDEV